ncbi:hypothetical protein CWE16_00580 [Synechococcus sp. BS55D]|nr:hypothetical protein CWE16_00580 [Synechococcus sp. BS55D]
MLSRPRQLLLFQFKLPNQPLTKLVAHHYLREKLTYSRVPDTTEVLDRSIGGFWKQIFVSCQFNESEESLYRASL